ncbi:Peptidase family M28 [Pedobacter westerhofensis]|uniref:Peptidase family M28 n=1 Tax=Pedobacter westerhofensis TaxID=425512 RepID=A0A521FQ80_9SPHI|nr:M28 family peptidase [Pedobacter westerhofensis]SMO98276.1 Peptidase family M28 [Pedobacter westerhofensis]
MFNPFIKHLQATFLVCLLAAVHVSAQVADYGHSIVKKLASPEFKGRGYVEDGAKKASVFIAGEFAKDGLIPFNSGSYFQDYHLSVNTFPGKVFVQLDRNTLKTAVDYLVSASSPSVKGKFNVITAGRHELLSAESAAILALRAKDAFILLDNRPGVNETPEETSRIKENVQRLEYDEQLVFKGLLIFTSDKLTWTTETYQSSRPVITINKTGLDLKSIHELNIEVEANLVPDYQPRNVGGIVKGTAVPDSMLVITAHYDHLGMMGKKVYFPGANDNASGTALMLSMARYYSKHPGKYTMVFIAFSGEEIGMLGSQAFVDQPLIDLKKIRFLTNFDMAGTGEEGIRVVNGSIYKNRFDQLVKLNDSYKLLPKVDIRGESCNSDHCRFYQRGVPSFFIYTQGGIRAYHDIYDRAETLPLTAFENYFKLMQKFFDQL